jgi:hypothetical protein
MPFETKFHSARQPWYHEFETCKNGEHIPAKERIEGDGGKPMCPECQRIALPATPRFDS